MARSKADEKRSAKGKCERLRGDEKRRRLIRIVVGYKREAQRVARLASSLTNNVRFRWQLTAAVNTDFRHLNINSAPNFTYLSGSATS